MAILITFLIIVLAITFGSEGILCMIRRARYRMNHCAEGNADPTIDIGFTLDRWIRETPVIRNALIWRPDGDTALGYARWSRDDKALLRVLYDRLKDNGETDSAVEPSVDGYRYYEDGPDERLNSVREIAYSRDIAKWTFFAHVAQSLCVEIAGAVSWSMTEMSPARLAYLLDSRHMYTWSSHMGRHVLEKSQGMATPGDPGRVYQFLVDADIIKGTQRASVLALLEWCRRLYHDGSYGDVSPESRQWFDVHWQYEGYQPVERTIAGTDRTGPGGTQHWTHGCQGTTGFLRILLRTINIPVARADGCGHAIPHFLSINAFLSHGDDPYNRVMREYTPEIAMTEILLSDDRLDGFFDPCEHVGRGVTEAVARLLPDQLIAMHCADISAGVSREEGQVMEFLQGHNLDVSFLTRTRFWERLQEELDRRGGCDGLI